MPQGSSEELQLSSHAPTAAPWAQTPRPGLGKALRWHLEQSVDAVSPPLAHTACRPCVLLRGAGQCPGKGWTCDVTEPCPEPSPWHQLSSHPQPPGPADPCFHIPSATLVFLSAGVRNEPLSLALPKWHGWEGSLCCSKGGEGFALRRERVWLLREGTAETVPGWRAKPAFKRSSACPGEDEFVSLSVMGSPRVFQVKTAPFSKWSQQPSPAECQELHLTPPWQAGNAEGQTQEPERSSATKAGLRPCPLCPSASPGPTRARLDFVQGSGCDSMVTLWWLSWVCLPLLKPGGPVSVALEGIVSCCRNIPAGPVHSRG